MVLRWISPNKLIASAVNLTDERVIPHLWKLRGEALAGLHQVEEAEAALRAAQESALAQGLRPLLWRICVALGRLYQARGDQEEARQAFDSARTTIEELAAPILDEKLRETFLSSATLRLPRLRPLTPRRATKQAYGGLTEREREVAILLANGKSNREIAERLVADDGKLRLARLARNDLDPGQARNRTHELGSRGAKIRP